MTRINTHLRTFLAILGVGMGVQALADFGSQYVVHNGYARRKLFVSEKIGGSGYYRARFDVPKEYGRFIADVPMNIDRSMFCMRMRRAGFETLNLSILWPILYCSAATRTCT